MESRWSTRKKDNAPRGVYSTAKGFVGHPLHLWRRLPERAQGTHRPA